MQTRRSFLKTSAAMFAAIGVRLDFAGSSIPPVDLSQFCDTDRGHWDLTKPWTVGGHRYASDHRILVRVATADPDDVRVVSYGRVERIGDDSKIPPQAHSAHRFPWDRCRLAEQPWPALAREYGVGSCPDHHVGLQPCPESIHKTDAELADFCDGCGGMGQVATAVCPTCGVKAVDPDFYRPCLQPMGAALFIGENYDDLIRGLPGVLFSIPPDATVEPLPAICFRFDGGEGMVMPRLPPEEWEISRYPRLDR